MACVFILFETTEVAISMALVIRSSVYCLKKSSCSINLSKKSTMKK